MFTAPMTRKALIILCEVDFFTGNGDYIEGVLYNALRGALKPRCRKLSPRGKKIDITFESMDDWNAVYNRLYDIVDAEYWNNTALLNYLDELRHFLHHGEVKQKEVVEIGRDWHKEVDEYVEQSFIKMSKFLAGNTSLPTKWTPKLKISWHPNRGTSRGGCHGRTGHYSGHGGISLALAAYFDGNGNATKQFKEYSHIAHGKNIGSIESDDWKVHIDALVAHEIAHAAQRYLGRNQERYYTIMKAPHGEGWQNLYRMLRIEFVNGRIS